jgi:hypothetical protein
MAAWDTVRPMRACSGHRAPIPRALLSVAAGVLCGWLSAGQAHAQAAPKDAKDAQAEKALAAAMGSDYLETRFDQAAHKLRAAIDACGDAGCSPAVKARLFVALGSVLAHGEKQLEDARDAFTEALRLDPSAKPDPDLSSAEITFAFEQARTAAAASAGGAAALQITPPPEQLVRTPVPLYAELSADLFDKTRQVTVWYQPPGATSFRSLVLKKLRDRAFGINIPCSDLAAEGTLRYHLAAVDAQGAILVSAGTRAAPLTTQIKASLASEPPHWPGFAPPATCANAEKERAEQCLDDRQCSEGFSCVGGACTERRAAPPPSPDVRRSWVGLTFSPDVSMLSGEGVCALSTQQDEHWVCLRSDKSRYDGTPAPGVADNVNFGFALATQRVAVAYDRLLLDNLTVGGRIGLAMRGATDGGASFLPLHAEARAQYYVGKRPFESLGVRLFVLASAGLAQVDTQVDVEVLEDDAACAPTPDSTTCTKPGRSGRTEPRQQTLTVYKQAGQGFVSIGGGVGYAPLDAVSLNLALRASLTLPVVTAVISPEIGVSMGF